MAEMWYYTNEGKQMDPVSMKELKRLVSDGVLKPTDMVWKDGMARWIRASSVKELYPDPTAALDHFFTHTKQEGGKGPTNSTNSPTAVTAGSAGSNSKQAPAASMGGGSSSPSSSDDGASEPGGNRRRSNDDDRDSGKGGKGGLILLIVGVLAAGFVFVALVGGVAILIFVTQSGDPAPPPVVQNNPKDKEKEKDKKLDDPPAKKETKNDPLADDVKTGAGSFSQISMGPGQQHEFKLRVRGGHNATITVTNHSKAKGNFKLFVTKDSNGEAVKLNAVPNNSAQLQFSFPDDEVVRARVVNASTFGSKVKCTVEYNGG